jgi:hypothetical protein
MCMQISAALIAVSLAATFTNCWAFLLGVLAVTLLRMLCVSLLAHQPCAAQCVPYHLPSATGGVLAC